ncbi:MAG: hypothetical protein WBO76_08955, partial [Saprospiraceae bacterium]
LNELSFITLINNQSSFSHTVLCLSLNFKSIFLNAQIISFKDSANYLGLLHQMISSVRRDY